MPGATRYTLLSAVLLAALLSSASGSLQHDWLPRDKRSIPSAAAPVAPAAPVAGTSDGSECWRNFATDAQACPVVQVAFFSDARCSTPLPLVRTVPTAFINHNKQMLFDGAVAHSLHSPFGSIRILGAVPGIGLGFAREEESDTVVQNVAWMSSAETLKAYKQKSCVTFPNLDPTKVGVWTAKFDEAFNQQGYVWNPNNIPVKQTGAACRKRRRRASAHSKKSPTCPVCLEGASYGGGGVLELYESEDCQGPAKRQLYSTVQCTPLNTTSFRSFKAVQPHGTTIDAIFSPAYYDLGSQGYHACAQKDVTKMPFRAAECQKMDNRNMFVGVYGNDPAFPMPGPGPEDKVLKKASGGLLLSPSPHPHPK